MNEIKIHLCGDIMIGRSFNDTFASDPNFNIWGDVLDVFNKSDFVIGNLETTITDSNNKFPNKMFNFKLESQHKNILKKANISHVNLANNHIIDYNIEGMNDTITALNSMKITHSGVRNYPNPIYKIIKNTKIGILSFTDHYDYWKQFIFYIDLDNSDSKKELLEHIKKAKKECDILILSIHYGSNYVNTLSENAKRFFRKILSAGVDIIHGHSAHHVLPIEHVVINGVNKYILYSMGDFIDDYAVDSYFRNDLAFIAEIIIENNKITKLNAYPTKIHIMYKNNVVFPFVKLLDSMDDDYKFVMNKLFGKNGGNSGNSGNSGSKKYRLVS